MKYSLRFGVVLLGLVMIGGARLGAQVATNAPGSTQMPPPLLDQDEMTELKQAREKVFESNPDLKAENDKLKAMHDASATPTADQRNAAFVEWKAYQKKMRAEMLKVDPKMGPIFAKIDAARKNGTPTPFQPASH
jgi:hypothetical protein